jgi:hypothetical protein
MNNRFKSFISLALEVGVGHLHICSTATHAKEKLWKKNIFFLSNKRERGKNV